jgi:hypothetical protein
MVCSGIEVDPLCQFDSDPVVSLNWRREGMQLLLGRFWAWLCGCFDAKERSRRAERKKTRQMAEFLDRNSRIGEGKG